jgi:hypothetical protein
MADTLAEKAKRQEAQRLAKLKAELAKMRKEKRPKPKQGG